MMRAPQKHLFTKLVVLMLVPAVALMAGCEEDEGPSGPTQAGMAAALSYVGYADAATQTLVCATCHADLAEGWSETGHAHAITTLYSSDHAASYCRPCHTTGWNDSDGLYGADDAFAAASADTSRYVNVQCESCHGPASQHNSLDRSGHDVLMLDDAELWEADLCGVCHEGTHHPYLSEWEQSAHSGAHLSAGGLVVTNPGCVHCHDARAFQVWVEEDEEGFVPDEPTGITCQGCHTGHDDDNPGQLRLPLGDDILCAKCHNAEGALPGETVHHATWEVFTGTLGFDYGIDPPDSPHAALALTEGCVYCHVFKTPYVSDLDPAGTGHTFEPRLEACAQCHGTLTDFDLYGAQTATQALIDALQAEIDAAGTTDMATTAYDNALYILQVALSEGSVGIHNTDYIQALLQEAIDDFDPTGS
ncbi:multiheme c-type cytochrome [Gemmatimonadota bacterium]